MDLTQDQSLTVILVVVIASMAVIALILEARRFRRSRQVLSTPYQSPAVDQVMSTSYVGQAAGAWSEDQPTAGADAGNGADPDAAGAADAIADAAAAEAPESPAPDTMLANDLADDDAGAAAAVDPIGGLLDAAAFSQRVADEERRIQRYGRPATIAMVELHGLDRLIERLGPEAADRVVPAVADTLKRLARGSDLVARLDVGRFAVLLPETDEISAINYVERVRRACDLWLESGAIAMQLAIGWAGTSGEPPLSEAQRTATERMFVESRRFGRRPD